MEEKIEEENLYIACIWPVADEQKIPMAEAAIRQLGSIVYTKDVELTYAGMRNFMILIYGHQPWAGTFENHYLGIKGKLDACYCEGKPVKTYVFYAPSLAAVLAVKESIRRLFGIGKNSIHISDNRKETKDMIRLLYDPDSVRLLNDSYSHAHGYGEADPMNKKACKQKRISIIVAVYNVAEYVERCVASILAQTYEEFELILVDDGSTDGSGEICNRLKEADNRIQVIHQENKGLSAARNRGLSAATGDYITYIDSDDYVAPCYLEVLFHNAVTYQADVSVCGFQYIRADKKAKKTKGAGTAEKEVKLYSGKMAAGEIVAENKRSMITAWGKLYHRRLRSLLIYPKGRLHEDEFVTYQVLYEAVKVVVTEQPLYCYFQREKSITNSGYSRRRLDKLAALKEAITFFENQQEKELMAYAVKRYLLNIPIAWYRVKKYLPEEKLLLGKLNREWEKVYNQRKADIAGICSLTDKFALLIFKISPGIYSIVAAMVERILPNI